jgi:hypothetical protein
MMTVQRDDPRCQHVGGAAPPARFLHRPDTCTLGEICGVRPWLGNAGKATDRRDLFLTFP